MSNVSESLRSLTKNERPSAIRSEEMSDCELIAQVAQKKWANEWIDRFFERIAYLLIFEQKTSDSLGKPMSQILALHTVHRGFPIYIYIFTHFSANQLILYSTLHC